MFEDHPLWKATREMLAQAFIDLATAIRQSDLERIEEERLNIFGLREQAASIFGAEVQHLDFVALCDALTVLGASPDIPDC